MVTCGSESLSSSASLRRRYLLSGSCSERVAHDLGGKTKLFAGFVLCVAGAYAIVSALREGSGYETEVQPSTGRIVALGAALSIDNVAVGFALGAYHVNVLLAA
jgi:putative Mn2+ efflux pump MntP